MIVIFPAGELVSAGKRVRAKTGVGRLALETRVPMIPLGMEASPQPVMKWSVLRQGREHSGMWQVSGKCHLNFGAPWKPSLTDHDPENIRMLTDELMNRSYSPVTDTQKGTLCVSPTSLNPILQ